MGDKVFIPTLVVALLSLPSLARAQCSTDDLDMNGVPDVCPAGSNYIEGTSAGETLVGGSGVDCIFGLGGDDTIRGQGGDDYICGGDGADFLVGNNGNDSLYGEGGNDTIRGSGDDDFLSGGDGNDILEGRGGADILVGGDGDDDLQGQAGADTLSGEGGDDTLAGGNGDDSLSGGDGIDTLDGEGGIDTCVEEVPGTADRLTNCETITYALVTDLDVHVAEPGVLVRWDTSSEVGVVAFRLWRRGLRGALIWVGEVLASPDGSPFGASYVLHDSEAPSGGSLEYLLEERTVAGGSLQHGPFVRSPGTAPRVRSSAGHGIGRARVPHPFALQKFARPAPSEQVGSRSKAAEPGSAAEITVTHAGIVEVRADALASVLGRSTAEVGELIRGGQLHLELRGESIAWHDLDDGTALRFIAPRNRSPFSRELRYLLSVEEGVMMETAAFAPTPSVEAHEFLETARFEENAFPGPAGGPDPRQDLFFWHALAGDTEAVIPVPLAGLSGASAEELRLVVHVAVDLPEQAHRVELLWNGASLGTFDLFGQTRHTITVPFGGIVAGEQNELVVQHQLAGEAPPALYVDALEIDYWRFAHANDSLFVFGGGSEGVSTVTGVGTSTVLLYDASNPRRPLRYEEAEVGEEGLLSFVTQSAEQRFLVATPGSVGPPTAITPHRPVDLRSIESGAEYLVLAPSHFLEDAQALTDYREADGYDVLLVDVDDIYWSFADGEPDPLAIREFLQHAWSRWETRPAFVTLIGKGSLDYRDLQGHGGNWMPPMLAPTEGGLFPSDSILGDVEGDDGVPELAVGRLPITDGKQLSAILASIEAFERGHRTMSALFVSDDSESREFAAASAFLTEAMSESRTEEIDLGSETLEDARQRLFSLWASPMSWLSYVGHGGLDRLANEGLLTADDIPALAELESSPVLLAWTCNILRFDIPGYSSLGEQLLTAGTSAAIFSATGWSNHVETDALRTALSEAAFSADSETIGDAMLVAHQAATDAPRAVHHVYALFGDPALRLREAKAVPDPGTPPVDDPTEPGGTPAAADDGASSSSGCAAGPIGAGHGSVALVLSMLCLTFLIRRRRPAGGAGSDSTDSLS